jgi:hypothetical protein
MRTIARGENANMSHHVDAEKSLVTVTHTVKENRETDVRTELTWKFDFSNCSQAQILELAERAVRIRKQAEWRKSDDRDNEEKWDNVVFDVAEEITETRRVSSPMERANKLLDKLTQEQIEELLSKHTK